VKRYASVAPDLYEPHPEPLRRRQQDVHGADDGDRRGRPRLGGGLPGRVVSGQPRLSPYVQASICPPTTPKAGRWCAPSPARTDTPEDPMPDFCRPDEADLRPSHLGRDPLHEPILVATFIAVALGALAILGALSYFRLWGPLFGATGSPASTTRRSASCTSCSAGDAAARLFPTRS